MARTSSHPFLIRKEINAILLTAFLLVLTTSPVYGASLRYRRQTGSRYTVNTLAVVDNKMYSWFQQWLSSSNWAGTNVDAKLKEYVSLIVHQMNVRLNNTSNLPLLKLVQMSINNNIVPGASSGTVDANNALTAFSEWLKTNQLASRYDHSILFSGYAFESQAQGGETKGRAYIARMCDPNGFSASVVQESGGFQSAHYAAHEVGHSLGSEHDGEGKSINCSPADRYVMAPTRDGNGTAQNIANPWYFSTCSTSVITSSLNTFKSASSNCFSPDVAPMPEFTATFNSAAGQLYPADVQCQMMYGQTSRLCLGTPFVNLSEICTSMFCLLPTGQGCAGHFAAEGTTCGNMKWCRSGRCVASNSAPSISENCPNGDSVLLINGKQCSDYITAHAWVCYNQTIRETVCCASCAVVRRNSPACPYGDVTLGCKREYCGRYISNSDCCETCGSGPPSYSCTDVASIDGLSCGQRTVLKQQQGCYNSTVATSCCQTCLNKQTSKADCQYGDRYLGSRCATATNETLDCVTKKNDCCATCGSSDVRHLLHWTSVPLLVVLSLWGGHHSWDNGFI